MPAALSNLGVALYELKDYEEAARAQRKAIAANPDFAEAHSNLGNALHALRRFDEAIAAYRRAIEIKPNYADAWANLGTTLHHSGSFEEGIVGVAPRHRAGAASRQCPFRARHSLADARRSRRGLGRIRMAAALDRAQGPALSRNGPGRAKTSPASTSMCRPSRVSAIACNSRATCRSLAARAGSGHAAGASAARDADAREPARHHRARRSRRSGALSMRRRAVEPAAAVQDAARNHSGRRALSARAGGGGAALEEAARQDGRASRSAWCGPAIPNTSTIIRRSHRSVDAGAALRRARHVVREPAVRPARGRSQEAASAATSRSRICRPTSADFADTAAADRRARSGDHGRYVGRASRRRARQAGLGAAAVGDRLALDARSARTIPGIRPCGCSARRRARTGPT